MALNEFIYEKDNFALLPTGFGDNLVIDHSIAACRGLVMSTRIQSLSKFFLFGLFFE